MNVRTSEAGSAFAEFVACTRPRLARALVAAYGVERGSEAVSEAMAFAWEHWDRVEVMANPAGYLYRVGQSRTRPRLRRPAFPPVDADRTPWVEPGLPRALRRLSRSQRVAVVLVHGFGWTLTEVAEMTGVAKGSVQTHLTRGLSKLRTDLGEDDG